VRDRLIESWNDTNQHFDSLQVKRVAYLSLEFLMGRSLQNSLLNMDLQDSYRTALKEMGCVLGGWLWRERVVMDSAAGWQ